MLIAFVAILIIALLAALVSFTIMGLRHSAHTKALANTAHQRGILFSREDPFNIPLRFSQFAVISNGHSPRAYNVMHGQLGSWTGRVFTFRYEVGHGTKRTTKHYGVAVLELHSSFPDVLMWNTTVDDQSPLEMRKSDGQIACWSYVGSKITAEVLAAIALSLGEKGLGIQMHGNILMLSMPDFGAGQWDYSAWLDEVLCIPEYIQANSARFACHPSGKIA